MLILTFRLEFFLEKHSFGLRCQLGTAFFTFFCCRTLVSSFRFRLEFYLLQQGLRGACGNVISLCLLYLSGQLHLIIIKCTFKRGFVFFILKYFLKIYLFLYNIVVLKRNIVIMFILNYQSYQSIFLLFLRRNAIVNQ